MKVVPIRTGSAPVHASPVHGSPRLSFSHHEKFTGILFHGKNSGYSPRSSLHLEILQEKTKKKKEDVNRSSSSSSIRRALSENDMIRSVAKVSDRFSAFDRRRSFPARMPEEEKEEGAGASVMLKKVSPLRMDDDDDDNCGRDAGVLIGDEVLLEEVEFSGGGIGKGRKIGGGSGGDGFSGGNADQDKIGDYYREMLKANPGNPLLLRNYGKFLHEVNRDVARAEECYERAILTSPNDGEVLSLYAKLIWETHRDEERAEAYFDRAVQASPDDCHVLGSYAQFLWDAEEDEEEEEGAEESETKLPSTLVEAF